MNSFVQVSNCVPNTISSMEMIDIQYTSLTALMLQYTDQFVSNMQTQLEESRLREAELLGALKEMQDKVLDLEKVR